MPLLPPRGRSGTRNEGKITTKTTKDTKMEFDELSNRVLGCAIEVHRALGPGLLESTYEQCLAHELKLAGIPFKLQWPVPVEYKTIHLDCGYRLDILIDDVLIVELKSVEKILGIHEAQLLTYMKLARIRTGLLINFNVQRLRDGIKRFVL
jgi:GxxExxY protein